MFKIQFRDITASGRFVWRDVRFVPRFATEAEAWARVATFDQDGLIDRVNHRVVQV
jgi:hypothetical protein